LHTGLRVNATVNPSLRLQTSLVNGWNNDPDNNIGKTLAPTPPLPRRIPA